MATTTSHQALNEALEQLVSSSRCGVLDRPDRQVQCKDAALALNSDLLGQVLGSPLHGVSPGPSRSSSPAASYHTARTTSSRVDDIRFSTRSPNNSIRSSDGRERHRMVAFPPTPSTSPPPERSSGQFAETSQPTPERVFPIRQRHTNQVRPTLTISTRNFSSGPTLQTSLLAGSPPSSSLEVNCPAFMRRHTTDGAPPSTRSPLLPVSHHASRLRRQASLTSGEFDVSKWREMGSAAQAERAYVFPRERSNGNGHPYTLESVPCVSSVRPLKSPVVGLFEESSSTPLSESEESVLLGLSSICLDKKRPVTSLPQRSSSLLHHRLGPHDHQHPQVDPTVQVHQDQRSPNLNRMADDTASIVSEPSSSFSPSAATNSLPSTKTSLSRSARSGKEGHASEEINIQLNTKLSEVAQARLDRRRMILLEIVETEISYVQDLHLLVHVYLRHLSALPHLTQEDHARVSRNTRDLLDFHQQLAGQMVEILQSCSMGYAEADGKTIDKVTCGLANLFVRENLSFSLYNDYCAGSTEAASLMRTIGRRADFESYERRCAIDSSQNAFPTLADILAGRESQPQRVRLRFKDMVISPVQRVCRYPLLLAALLCDVHCDRPATEVVAAVEAAQAVMRAAAENADEARLRTEAEIKTREVASRFEGFQHQPPVLTRQFLNNLGTCRLVGVLEVLYHHPVHAPLEVPARVKYCAAVLYRGYLILAKIRRNGTFEARHYWPLEAFELIDIQEGLLPHSIRLTMRDHHFDLSACCEAEKDQWAAELRAARDESTVPPFEMPSSIALFAPRSRHASAGVLDMGPRPVLSIVSEAPPQIPEFNQGNSTLDMPFTDSPISTPSTMSPSALLKPQIDAIKGRHVSKDDQHPHSTPPEYRVSQPARPLLLRRPSLTTRLNADRCLSGIMTESIATARSKVQLQLETAAANAAAAQPALDPRRISMFDSPILRKPRSRTRSLTGERRDKRSSTVDVIPASSAVRGAVIPPRPSQQTLMARRSVLSDGGRGERTDGGDSSSELTRNYSSASLNELAFSRRRAMESLQLTPSKKLTRHLSTRGHSRTKSMPSSPITPFRMSTEHPSEANSEDRLETLQASDKEKDSGPSREQTDDEGYVVISDFYPKGPNAPKPLRRIGSRLSPPTPSASLPNSNGGGPVGTIRRSLSFFSRKQLNIDNDNYPSDAAANVRSVSTSSVVASSGEATPVRHRSDGGGPREPPSVTVPINSSEPATPKVKRRRSMRLFGQGLRAFTPI